VSELYLDSNLRQMQEAVHCNTPCSTSLLHFYMAIVSASNHGLWNTYSTQL